VPQVAVRPGKEKADPDHRVATGLRERDPLREPVVTRDPTGDYRTSLVLAHGPHTVAPGTTALATLTTPSTPGVMGHTGTFLAYTDRLITQAATEEADTEDRVVAVREDIIENIIRRSMSFIDRQLANNLRDLNTTDILNRVRTVRAWLGYTCAPGLATHARLAWLHATHAHRGETLLIFFSPPPPLDEAGLQYGGGEHSP